jgi:D-arginine dehydrogenase
LQTADFAVIGAGIAGASAAYRLAAHGSVVLVEQEEAPGYHTTGRSAALYSRRYKNPLIRGLAAASGAFLEGPPEGFAEHPLLAPRGLMIVGRPDQQAALDGQFTADQIASGLAGAIPVAEACRLVPVLDPAYLGGALLLPSAKDIDVNGLHRGFLGGFARAGGRVVTDAELISARREGGAWRIETKAGDFAAGAVVNAAGAWVDAVAERCGVRPLGIRPMRRTCVTFDPPAGLDPAAWPMVMDAGEAFYFKPEAGRILASPCDETDQPPSDAQPEELDVAIAVDRVERATTLNVGRITHRWAGLRCFLADRMPVAAEDPEAPGFVWLAGLGGFGIMTSEALGRAAAAAALGEPLPADLAAEGVTAEMLSPLRLLEG